MSKLKLFCVIGHQGSTVSGQFVRSIKEGHPHRTHFKGWAACIIGVLAAKYGKMPAADSFGFFEQGYIFKAAAIEFSCCSKSRYTRSDNAYSVIRIDRVGDSACLLN